jgi:quercetin dioxygenase-like cupin family protein
MLHTMRVHRAEEMASRQITVFESEAASVAHIAQGDNVTVVRIELGAGGRLGMHPAAAPQLFIIVEGTGTVLSDGQAPREVLAGTTVLLQQGEPHETRSETGLTAIVVEAKILELAAQAIADDLPATAP